MKRTGFTLTELMIVIAIIAILAGLGFSAFMGATTQAREQRTQSQIRRIDQLIRERHEGYRTRAVPLKIPAGVNPLPAIYPSSPTRANALLRLLVLRSLMRMELPDRRTDIVNFSTSPPSPEVPGLSAGVVNLASWMPAYGSGSIKAYCSLQRSYFSKAVRALGGNAANPTTFNVLNNWTQQNEGAECLYLILSTMRDGDKSALDYFDATEIGDTDGDGMNEVLDGFGMPIEFLRWAPGYVPTLSQPLESLQVGDVLVAPDPFDPVKADVHWGSAVPPYALFPLIFSAGPDKKYDIASQLPASFRYAVPPAASGSPINLPNDPYFIPYNTAAFGTSTHLIGEPFDADQDGDLSFNDNITNQSKQQ